MAAGRHGVSDRQYDLRLRLIHLDLLYGAFSTYYPCREQQTATSYTIMACNLGGVHRAFVRYLFLQYHQDAIFVCGGMLGPVLTSAAQEKRQDASAAAFVGMTAALLYYHHTGVEATK